jgi:2-iminobutanoate/2-iminopropanoate deaminase
LKEVIFTGAGARPIGPFSQAIRANGLVFVSGQVAIDPATGKLSGGDTAEQADRALRAVQAILEAAGSSLEKVVRATVYLRNLEDFGRLNEVYARYFPADPPARTTFEVARLPLDALVEIDVIALA